MMLADFLSIPYRANGRGYDGLDCYGLVRLVRHHLFGRGMLPAWSAVDADDKRGLTAAVIKQRVGMRLCTPKPGAIATGWRARLCVHVGIVVPIDGRLMILETDEDFGTRVTQRNLFEHRFLRVAYYD